MCHLSKRTSDMKINFRFFYFLVLTLIITSCSDNIKDTSKRNENWGWWIDSKSGKGMWVPVKGGNTDKSGSYSLFYYNGKLYKTGKLLNGKEVDTTYYYDINGHRQSYTFLIKDSVNSRFFKDGLNIQYNQLGQVTSRAIIKNHELGDKSTTYYENGQVKTLRNLFNNTGWITKYYENGNVEDSIYQYRKNELVSVKNWYESGKIKAINSYKSPKPMVAMLFYENGVVKDSGLLVNGLAEGKVVKRFENGQIHFLVHFKNNKPHGLQKEFYDNGKLKFEVNMNNNVPDGELNGYDENGKLIRHEIYENGTLQKAN